MIIKVQSISDLITNSSSEVFTIYTAKAIQEFKNIVSTLIGRNFDDVFNLEIHYTDWAEKDYNHDTDRGDLSFEDWCFKQDSNSFEGPTYILGFCVTAKNPEDKSKEDAINRIYYLFESETRYC